MKNTHSHVLTLLLAALPLSIGVCQVNSNENNALVFQINEVEQARISGTSGNVGIGTTDPMAKLTVAGNISSTGVVQVSGSSLTCSSAIKGAMRFSNTSSTLEYCNSTAWTSLGPSDTAVTGGASYRSAVQSIGTGSWTAISFDSETFDTAGMVDIAGQPTRVTVPSGRSGYYLINTWVQYPANATGGRWVQIYKNGVGDYYCNIPASASLGGAQGFVCSTVLYLAAGDYLQLYTYQNSGGSLNANASLRVAQLAPQDASQGGGGATPAGSTGDIQFNSGGALAADTGQLFWDDANNRLGIGTTSPNAKLDVNGTVSATSFAGNGTNVTGVVHGVSVTTYATAGTYFYAPPANTTMIEVIVQGGGGGGGGVDGQNVSGYYAISSGGGGGGWAEKYINSPNTSYTVVVGASGAGGVAGANNGSAGGTSYFNGTGVAVQATGGTGGSGEIQATSGSGGTGFSGAGSGGDINGAAPHSYTITRWVNGASTNAWDGASGMPSRFGAGPTYNSTATGSAGTYCGTGGSGVYYTTQSSSNYAGGAGKAGCVVIKAYY